ncbi:beta-hydroxydecanoyl-ACP dehydratase [Nocardia sp. NBC_00508]|uniref:beta-hydroxydecanoyl-ACP dehydratase n=1 Tax=Nocardia sp. NBC_00508 TaxID=2975992 RepID=UPI002E81708F|nr:beta-hydroxydecanoyl-ACP dehydratase [Nocardia sp. NBC_00508]WUD67219.1 beta-hydroxydecanoyl-ACP dehydratase [Nocardia sp. NBC_00508]
MTTLEFDGVPFDPVTAPAAPAVVQGSGQVRPPRRADSEGAFRGSVDDNRSDAVSGNPTTDLAHSETKRATVEGQAPRRAGSGSDGSPQGHVGDYRADAPGMPSAAMRLAYSEVESASLASPATDPVAVADRPAGPLAEIRSGVVAAHRAALSAQLAMQRAVWQRALRRTTTATEPNATDPARGAGLDSYVSGAGHQGVHDEPAQHDRDHDGAYQRHDDHSRRGAEDPLASTPGEDSRTPVGVAAAESAFKPLARTDRTRLDRAALTRLAEGDLTGVFGLAYRRSGVDAVARLAASAPLALTEVTEIALYGGAGNGSVTARFQGDPRTATVQAAEVFALYLGMPLVLSGSSLVAECTGAVVGTGSGTITLTVTALDLVPRPHVAGTAIVAGAQGEIDVTVSVAERPGSGVGPGQVSEGLLLNEFHMTHLARGDQAIAMGPEFAPYTGVRATRLPTGGLLLVDRVLDFDGSRGQLDAASYATEYDSPADSWYYADTANESMPHFVYMETSLQAALLMGYYAGPTLTQPGTTLSLRNLGGTATVLRRIDLRDKTIHQSSRLLSTTILPGSSLQTFDYTLSADGEPFYTGETMFGYFSDQALANQTGLDAGRTVPTWLAENPGARLRTIDVAARRADPHARLCARRTLALIDQVDVVDDGGTYEAGYLHSLREIDPSDWYFTRHFHLDPVIPGSLGVESVIHAIQEWMIDAGFADTIGDPVFRIPADIPFRWRYRGQFLPTDGTVELEAHIKEVRRGPEGVTVIADGSLWKPGLRIYELIDLAVELGERRQRR